VLLPSASLLAYGGIHSIRDLRLHPLRHLSAVRVRLGPSYRARASMGWIRWPLSTWACLSDSFCSLWVTTCWRISGAPRHCLRLVPMGYTPVLDYDGQSGRCFYGQPVSVQVMEWWAAPHSLRDLGGLILIRVWARVYLLIARKRLLLSRTQHFPSAFTPLH
jgi:hypothetical protein